MKEYIVPFVVIVVIVNFWPAVIGCIDEASGKETRPMRRLELIIPGYRFGRWMMKPLLKPVTAAQGEK